MKRLYPYFPVLLFGAVVFVLASDELSWNGMILSKRLAILFILWLALLPSVLLSKRGLEPAWQRSLYEMMPRPVFVRTRVNSIVFMALVLLLLLILFFTGILQIGHWQDILSAFLVFFCSSPLYVRFFQATEGPFRGEFGDWLYDHKSDVLKGKAAFKGIPITVETRVARYQAVFSYVLAAKFFESPLILIDQNKAYAYWTLVSYSFLSFVFGWWNVPQGAVQAFRAIASNLKGGSIKTVGGILGRLHDHAVLVHLKLSSGEFGEEEERERIGQLGDRLDDLVQKADVGEFDGDEYGDGECVLYFYGGNADKLYAAMEPTLLLSPLSPGGHAVKQYGEGGRSKKVKIAFKA